MNSTEPGTTLRYTPFPEPNPYFTLEDLQWWADYFDQHWGRHVIELRVSYATRRYIIRLMSGLDALGSSVGSVGPVGPGVKTVATPDEPHGRVVFVLDGGVPAVEIFPTQRAAKP